MAGEKASKLIKLLFKGGVNTATERALLKSGSFSAKQNLRDVSGFKTRKGQSKLNTTELTGRTFKTLRQYIDVLGVKNLYAQLDNGAVHKADNTPPTVGTDFATGTNLNVIASATGTKPASWAELQDYLCFADGKRGLVYSGTGQKISKCVIYKSASTPPTIPAISEDYSSEATDSDTTRLVILDALGTNANDYLYIGTPLPAKSLTFTIQSVNSNVVTVSTRQYFSSVSGGSWANMAGFVDGTLSGGATLAQTGTITSTAPTDEQEHYQFGANLFWYRFKFSGALDGTVRVSEITYTSNGFIALRNIWNGVFEPAIEAQVERGDSSNLRYHTQPSTSIDISGLDIGRAIRFSSINPIVAFYIDVGGTPNKVYAKATATATGQLTVSATAKTITWSQANFLTAGFEDGMAITTAGFTNAGNNSSSFRIKRVTSDTIYLGDETTGLVAESDVNATIIYDIGTVTMTVKRWNGSSWATATITDGTSGITKSAFVWCARATDHQTQFNNTAYHAYWYEITLDKRVSNSVSIGIECLPYFDIGDIGLGKTCQAWKDRIVWSMDKYPSYLYITEQDNPMLLNGSQYGIVKAGDGRANDVVAQAQFHNELIVLQDEVGELGGCTTLFEGKNPPTYGKLLLSSFVGGMNAKSLIVVESVLAGVESNREYKTLAFILSQFGVMACDGRFVQRISDPIGNYFDSTKSEYINLSLKDRMWLAYDTTYNCLRIGLVSGASATACNIFPVFDLTTSGWGFDTPAQALSCMINAQASDDKSVIQIAGSESSGFLFHSNNGTSDAGTAINAYCDLELNGEGYTLLLHKAFLRVKAQSSGNITHTIAHMGNTTPIHSESFAMTARTGGDTFRREKVGKEIRSPHITDRFRCNTLDKEMHLLDIAYDLEAILE